MAIINLVALVVAWLFFYNVLKSRNRMLPALKASIITLLFGALIFRFSTDFYATIDRAFFSFKKDGDVQLSDSLLKIPPGKDSSYCNQFTDQNNEIITKISMRNNVRYCGEFWKFDSIENVILPYKLINSNEIVYWASPSLKITSKNNSPD